MTNETKKEIVAGSAALLLFALIFFEQQLPQFLLALLWLLGYAQGKLQGQENKL